MAAHFQFRRGTAAQWASVNPTLGDSEPGRENDTGQWKFGDGLTPWNDLSYEGGGSSSDVVATKNSVARVFSTEAQPAQGQLLWTGQANLIDSDPVPWLTVDGPVLALEPGHYGYTFATAVALSGTRLNVTLTLASGYPVVDHVVPAFDGIARANLNVFDYAPVEWGTNHLIVALSSDNGADDFSDLSCTLRIHRFSGAV